MTWRVHCRRPAAGQKGQGHQGFPAPLDSPTFPLDATPCGRASKIRGAHRGVWCSKGTLLMEAELFAAERCCPAPDGRALLCAANHARKIQGLKASRNLPDARNRAPVPPVSLHIFDVSAPKGRFGVSRGARKPFGVLAPFAPRRWEPASPPSDGGNSSRRWEPAIPVGVRRQSLAAGRRQFSRELYKSSP